MARNRRNTAVLRRGLDLFVADEIRIVDLRSFDLQIRLVSEITCTLDLGAALREFLDQLALLVRYLDFVSDKAIAARDQKVNPRILKVLAKRRR